MSVQLENVTIRYGEHLAVDDLSVTFHQGSIGLLGRNGAGKSSVLKALLGLVRPASGKIQFSELPSDASAAEVRPASEAWFASYTMYTLRLHCSLSLSAAFREMKPPESKPRRILC